MFARLRHIREPYRMILVGLATAVVTVVGKTWPMLAYPAWGLFLAFMAVCLYEDLKEPVNYSSLEVSGGVIEYTVGPLKKVVRLAEVCRVEFVREEAMFEDLYGPYIESKWVVQSGSDTPTEIMDEWPHRKQLLRAFKAYLPHFDEAAARSGFKALREGRWICYEDRPLDPAAGQGEEARAHSNL
jgi:hypothetical protein